MLSENTSQDKAFWVICFCRARWLLAGAKVASLTQGWAKQAWGWGRGVLGLKGNLEQRRRALNVPSLLISRERTRSLLFPTRMIGVCGWASLRRRRSWAVRWKLRLSVTEKTRMHTSQCSADRSWGTNTWMKHRVSSRLVLARTDRVTAADVWNVRQP